MQSNEVAGSTHIEKAGFIHCVEFLSKDEEQKRQQKAEHGRRHRVKPLPPLPDDGLVWVQTEDRQVPGTNQLTRQGPTWWRLHLNLSIGTKATYYQDLVKDRPPQFQLSCSNVPSPHSHGQ